MLERLLNGSNTKYIALAGIIFCFIFTAVCLKIFSERLPKDLGRDFAFNGKKSAGKPRGAGFIFISVFLAGAILFVRLNREVAIYLLLTFAAMMTGFLDDCSRAPWGEYKKGFLDLVIAIVLTVTFLKLNTNANTIYIGLSPAQNKEYVVPVWLFAILCVVLIWVSINVTNCSDGVDGLSGTLTITTLSTIIIINTIKKYKSMLGSSAYNRISYIIGLFIICLLAYLWFNATPSRLMMGDAGSRAMGIFIAIAVLKTRSPFLYLAVAFVLILDGGLGLLKVSLMRFFKIKILKNTRTPLHDHVRKVRGWSNTQTVFRFVIIQVMVSAVIVYIYA